MKKLLIIGLLLFGFGCSKKESFQTYRISRVQNTGSLDCLFTATASNGHEIKFYADCKKYKTGNTIKVQL